MLKLPEKNKKLLLHACCAPCSCSIIEDLKEAGIDFTVFFYNPNIFPQKEYDIRKNEMVRYCQKVGVPLVVGESEKTKKQWEDAVKGLELEPERGVRCQRCINHRLEKVAMYALKNGFDIIGTTLSFSRWKDTVFVNECGDAVTKDIMGVDFWDADWRQGERQLRNEKMIDKEGFYRQKYCGCFYSIGDNLK